MDRILIVCPVFNRINITIPFLYELRKIKSFRFHYDILLIDDGSIDDTGKIALQYFNEIRIIYGDGNLWWAGSVNIGFSYALENKYDFIYIVNDDIKLFKNTLNNLYSVSCIYKKAILTSLIVFDNTIVCAGYKKNSLFNLIFKKQILDQSILNNNKSVIKADTISSTSTLIPIYVIKKIGFFNQNDFPHNYSDLDYFSRANKQGIDLLVCFQSIVESKGSDSNFHRLLISKNRMFILKSFFNKKYANNFRVLIKSSYIKNLNIFHLTVFLIRFFPYFFWTVCKIFFPHNSLKNLLIKAGRFPT